MAYTPTTWSDGDVITAEKLNKLEQVSTETGADLKNKINAILAEMKKQGIMANS
ncbi:MAG: hypothetical protein E6727_14815 [Lachnospiraceae bacterium]|nr:hypothetical protein [Lachnospiraceae bacterium]